MIPICMDVGFDTVLTGKSENTLLLKEYRGQGIMDRLYEYATLECKDRGMQMIWGFTGAVTAFRRYGFQVFACCMTLSRPGNPRLAVRLALTSRRPLWKRVALAAAHVLQHLQLNRRTSDPPEAGDYSVTTRLTDRADLADLYSRLRKRNEHLVAINLSPQYLNWRVREHPFLKYTEYQVYEQDVLRAYSFVTLHEGVASISDLTSESDAATALLLRRIADDYRKTAALIRFFGNVDDPIAQGTMAQLRLLGFRAVGRPGNLVIRDLVQRDSGQRFDARHWHITGLWTEGYAM